MKTDHIINVFKKGGQAVIFTKFTEINDDGDIESSLITTTLIYKRHVHELLDIFPVRVFTDLVWNAMTFKGAINVHGMCLHPTFDTRTRKC